MSTMYYTTPEGEKIGQAHFLGKEKGYHFTWCMYPLQFANHVWGRPFEEHRYIKDEYGTLLSFNNFWDIVTKASSQSFDERLDE